METLTSRDICDQLLNKIAGFVSSAFDHAPNQFRALYRRSVNDFPGGFRRIELVPKNLMTRKIATDCATNPSVALAILSNWYHAKPELHEAASGILKELGYQIVEPDFEKDSIAHQSLASKHIQVEDGASYFSPGNDIPQVDRLELTVMVALLGWFPNLEPSGTGP